MQAKSGFLQSGGKKLSLEKPLVMGILNVTPDSFSDGGKFFEPKVAVDRALAMINEGADIIDIGGESSGPGSEHVSLEEELKRILPVVRQLRAQTDAWISIDTYKAEVARQTIEIGADLINDVTAFRGDSDMADFLGKHEIPVVIMYSKDATARTTREMLQYKDVVRTVKDFLQERLEYGMRAGIARERFILDPGMGAFVSGDPQYSLQILKRLGEFQDFGLPILVGASRKGFIGNSDRLEGSLACAAMAVMNSASILRVHDVKETRRVVDMIHAIAGSTKYES